MSTHTINKPVPQISICSWCLGLGLAVSNTGNTSQAKYEVQRCDSVFCCRYKDDEAAEEMFDDMFDSVDSYNAWRTRVHATLQSLDFVSLEANPF